MKKLVIIALVLLGIQAPAFANGIMHDPGFASSNNYVKVAVAPNKQVIFDLTPGLYDDINEYKEMRKEVLRVLALFELGSDTFDIPADQKDVILQRADDFITAKDFDTSVASYSDLEDTIKEVKQIMSFKPFDPNYQDPDYL